MKLSKGNRCKRIEPLRIARRTIQKSPLHLRTFLPRSSLCGVVSDFIRSSDRPSYETVQLAGVGKACLFAQCGEAAAEAKELSNHRQGPHPLGASNVLLRPGLSYLPEIPAGFVQKVALGSCGAESSRGRNQARRYFTDVSTCS